MLNRLLNSGKFWLKLAFFSLSASLLVFAGLYASVYHFFSSDRIQAFAGQSLSDTRRTIRFDKSIGRSWFPRPTVTLKNLIISQPDSSYSAVHIKETRIGLSWKSLWTQKPVIEKWVVSDADITLERKHDGRWNLQDLRQQPSKNAQINRLIVENSRLRLRMENKEYLIEQFGFNAGSPDSSGRTFRASGTFKHAALPLSWQGSGLLKPTAEGWDIPRFHLAAQGRLKNEDLKITADSSLNWQPESGRLTAKNLALRADSSYHQFHITAQVPQLTLKPDSLLINTLSSAFTAGSMDNQWSGSLKLDKAHLRTSLATLDNVELNADYKTAGTQTNIALAGPLIWQQNKGFKADKIHLSTLQDVAGKTLRPRYVSLLEGSFSMSDPQHWQGRFSGYFDRQPTAVSLKYRRDSGQKPLLEAGIALNKLALAPYWDEIQAQSGDIYPEFLNNESLPDIEAQLKIGSILFPGLQLDNVETLISANRERIALSNFSAGLYGGRTEGGISMANTLPVSYHLQQNAQGVQIRPLLQDLFGFHSFSGTGDAVIDLTAKGQDRLSLLQRLNGTLSLNISDGAWHGIDINNILQSGNAKKETDKNLQTPFSRFSLSSVIEQGIGRHTDAELHSDSLRIVSSGYTDLAKQELSEELLVHNARNPASRPVPIKIKGPVSNPSVTLDYSRLTNGLATPEEKQKALENTLREQWNWLLPKKK